MDHLGRFRKSSSQLIRNARNDPIIDFCIFNIPVGIYWDETLTIGIAVTPHVLLNIIVGFCSIPSTLFKAFDRLLITSTCFSLLAVIKHSNFIMQGPQAVCCSFRLFLLVPNKFRKYYQFRYTITPVQTFKVCKVWKQKLINFRIERVTLKYIHKQGHHSIYQSNQKA